MVSVKIKKINPEEEVDKYNVCLVLSGTTEEEKLLIELVTKGHYNARLSSQVYGFSEENYEKHLLNVEKNKKEEE